MQDDEAAQLRCKPILHTNNVTWVATPEHGRKVVLITIITTKEAYCALAHYVLPPLSTHKLCTNRSFVLGDGRVSLRGWWELDVAVHRRRALGYVRSLHASFPSHKSRQWSIADVDCVHTEFIEEWF